VSAQFALSLAVLATAGLFIQRLSELQLVDRASGRRESSAVYRRLRTRRCGGRRHAAKSCRTPARATWALPGVEHAAAASFVPLGFLGYHTMQTEVDGYVPQRASR
jgi:hypothetical protein